MPSPIAKIEQRVGEAITRGIDWGARLNESTIATSAWTSLPTGLALENGAFTSDRATVRVSGGTAGVTYQVINTITTVAGDTLKSHFDVLVTG